MSTLKASLKKYAAVVAVGILLVLTMLVGTIMVEKRSEPAAEPVTYTDENGVKHSVSEDPPAGPWDGPSDLAEARANDTPDAGPDTNQH